MSPRALITVAVLAALLAAAAPAAAKLRAGPSGLGFYSAPSPLPGKKHGDLIWSRRESGSDALAGARSNRLVLYRSAGLAGPVAVSGSVALPKGRPPKGGWPVISWAHGTTGLADQCAPTRNGALTLYIHPLLQSWLKHGWAVVRTDYEGLGTPGEVHPYLIGASEGRAVLDIVRAARQLDRRIGRQVVIAGHSQGGHAALWATALAPKYTPELRVRGTDAFAPASHIAEQVPFVTALTAPNTGLSVLAMQITRGLDLARPSLAVRAALTEFAASRFGLVDTRCEGDLGAPDAFGDVVPAGLFKPSTDFAPFAAALNELVDPEGLTIRTPVRIDQGAADTTVLPAFSQQTAHAYRAAGTPTTYRTWPGATHGNVTAAAAKASTAWIKRRLR